MIQRLRVYRSLIGSSFRPERGECCAVSTTTLLSLLENNSDSNNNDQSTVGRHGNINTRCQFPFDGIVLTLDQLIDTATTMGLTAPSSASSPPSSLLSSLLYDIRLICQLEPSSANDASDQLHRLAGFLDDAEKARTNNIVVSTRPLPGQRCHRHHYHHHYHRSILDMVVIRAPQMDGNLNKMVEYLSSTLPAASIFLESINPGLVATSGDDGYDEDDDDDVGFTTTRSNAHGRPLGRHVHGVSHHLPGVDLNQLTDIADIFPPTRFAIDPTNLRSDDNNINIGVDISSDDGINTTPSMSNSYGLSREIEAVVQNTDVIRVSPSIFQKPPQQQHKSVVVEDNKSNQSDDNVKEETVLRHGLFGTGTLFGEIWCAHELDGAHETYVICDDNDSLDNDQDEDEDEGASNKDDGIYQDKMSINKDMDVTLLTSLAIRIHTAYEESKNWRAGAETRREEEIKEAIVAAKKKVGHTSWMQGRYCPEVIESAQILGLLIDVDDGSRVNHRLTTDMIKKRWHALAFQSHPDTADGSIRPAFSELRQHYLTLLAAAKQDARNDDSGLPKI